MSYLDARPLEEFLPNCFRGYKGLSNFKAHLSRAP